VEASPEAPLGIPDPKSIQPYLGLFTLVTLNPADLARISIPTMYLPPLFKVRGHRFIHAPSNVSATANNVARIFDPLTIDENTPTSHGLIPLSPQNAEFSQKRYWRLPVLPMAILAALFERLQLDSSGCDDIKIAKDIRSILDLHTRGQYPQAAGGSGDDGPSRGGGGRSSSKRKASDSESNASSDQGKKNARKVVRRKFGELDDLCGE
jgi:hypothetical protein